MAISTIEKATHGPSAYELIKDIFNRFLAVLLLAILSPFIAIIMVIIRIDSPGNPIFSQEQIGKDERKFMLYKFRSMYVNNDNSKHMAYIRKYINENSSSWLDENGKDTYELVNDPRITRFGALLRRSGLDELLQLINVSKGDMAFIGPRPDVPFAVEMYKAHHRNRLLVKPGITGLWQVSGRRSLSFEDMVQLDIDYMNRQSPVLDTKILLLTAREILFPDRVTVPE